MTAIAPIADVRIARVLDDLATRHAVPVRLGVVAPGGYGKTTLLGEISRLLDDALVVDDAHLLGDAELADLRVAVDRADRPVVVACRPWPRSRPLAALAEALGRSRPALALSPWTRDRVRAFLPVSARGLADHVHRLSGGVPRFVARLAGLTSTEVPADVLDSFHPDLDWLADDVRRYLLAAEAGVAHRLDLLAGLLHRDLDGVGDVLDEARATGLLAADGTLLPIARAAVAALSRTDRRIAVRCRLAELELAAGGPVLDLVRPLVGTGVAGPADAFQAAAREALPVDPALAARLLAAVGTPSAAVTVRRAAASALAGDLDTALRLADRVVAGEAGPHRGEAAEVAAIVLAHRGQLARGTELHRWSASPTSAAFAVIGRVGTGHRPADDVPEAPPTMLDGAATLMARGVLRTLDDDPTAALSTLLRAADLLEPAGRGVLLPDTPAALAALVALHSGQPAIADSVLDRAVATGQGGPLMSVRHRLLQAWTAMTRGEFAPGRELLAAVRRTPLEARDWLFAVALEAGIARRTSDLAGVKRTWEQACEAVLRHPVDLFTFLPLGEFAAAAARVRDRRRLAPHLTEAADLTARLGNPPLWTVQLHWSALHAAIIADDDEEAGHHAAALSTHAHRGGHPAAVAKAATTWLDVLAGRIDADAVEEAARDLHAAGQWWDAARLAGQAAIRTADRRAMVHLLDCARTLQGRPPTPVSTAPAERTDSRLSGREHEVAELVAKGLTYKQIGDRLFISAKTVEHHVARIRRRLGCANRAELLDQLRQLTDN
ncbi:helix-turn-helix transcriptional regulator [Saccharothrix violaceirubra]|uniref:DNA-binding CsgD family transcriptional regulator n=1 Tax=Saccharothrix violaceirubra TaxID=413306 RepID=A0A7W7WZD0_9PSEU|nr:LuxR C-terminal-related transcriptional regulator [Saccharothrix violaceirubra]MBB4968688.1 DNA-binding CsgD family transcriptional regulator [Saccharothrix violaceirubra]